MRRRSRAGRSVPEAHGRRGTSASSRSGALSGTAAAGRPGREHCLESPGSGAAFGRKPSGGSDQLLHRGQPTAERGVDVEIERPRVPTVRERSKSVRAAVVHLMPSTTSGRSLRGVSLSWTTSPSCRARRQRWTGDLDDVVAAGRQVEQCGGRSVRGQPLVCHQPSRRPGAAPHQVIGAPAIRNTDVVDPDPAALLGRASVETRERCPNLVEMVAGEHAVMLGCDACDSNVHVADMDVPSARTVGCCRHSCVADTCRRRIPTQPRMEG